MKYVDYDFVVSVRAWKFKFRWHSAFFSVTGQKL